MSERDSFIPATILFFEVVVAIAVCLVNAVEGNGSLLI